MEKFKNYITAVTAFILAATVLTAIIPDGAVKKSVKFVISAMLMGIFLSPISKIKDFDINLYTNEYTINNGTNDAYDRYAAEKVAAAVRGAVSEFAEKKNITAADTEVTCKNNKIENIVIDKKLVAYKNEISDILGVPCEYIQTAE